MKSKKSVAIVGAGIGGLATSIRLAALGFRVEVFEANSYPGGKLTEIRQDGFRFDAGPSLLTMPHLIDDLFHLAGKNPRDYFPYLPLNLTCTYFYEDGTKLHAYKDPEKFKAEIAGKTNEKVKNLDKALKRSATLYKLVGKMFLQRSLHDWRTYVNRDAFNAYFQFYKLEFFRTMDQANRQTFRDPKMVQFFNRYATYNGSSPFQTPATLNLIPHLEFNGGAYFPERGMYAITTSLYNLAREVGVKFNFNTYVDKILVKNRSIEGLMAAGEKIDFDIVVSNMDILPTYKQLLPDQYHPERYLKQPKSSSGLIFYWGINRSFPELHLHNILFSGNYREEFDHLFKQKTIHHDPTIYINISSKYKSDDAPGGMENWFTMINVPHQNGQDWDKLIDHARNNIITKINKTLNSNIANHIVSESILEPRTIESKTSSAFGALYGNSSNNIWAAFLRHPNYSKRIDRLYFCGGSVHPGGGIPLCLLSAKIVTDHILRR